jgi:hypothetical protein
MRELALLVLVASCGPAPAPAPPPAAESMPIASAAARPPRPARRSCHDLLRERNASLSADAGPRDAAVDASHDASAPISDADKVVASLRPKFRDCYNAGLRVDKTMEGCVIATLRVAPAGNVLSSSVLVHDGLSDGVATCIVDVLRAATFSPPGGDGSTLNVPVTFIQQQR